MQKFKILGRKKVLNNPYCPIEEQRVQLPDGSEANWWINRSADAVVIVPICKNGDLLYQKNYKHGSGKCIYEFPAGMIDSGEEPAQSVERELLEETGFQAQEVIKIGENFSNPTGASMKYHYFLALDCEKVAEPALEPAEQIEVLFAQDLKTLSKKLCETSLTSSATIGALSYVQHFYRLSKTNLL